MNRHEIRSKLFIYMLGDNIKRIYIKHLRLYYEIQAARETHHAPGTKKKVSRQQKRPKIPASV